MSISQVILAIEPWLRGNRPYSSMLEEEICGLLGFRVHFLARLLVGLEQALDNDRRLLIMGLV